MSGCYCKKTGKLDLALEYLRKALDIETRPSAEQLCENPAGTHLNICAVLSLMHRHTDALQVLNITTIHAVFTQYSVAAACPDRTADCNSGASQSDSTWHCRPQLTGYDPYRLLQRRHRIRVSSPSPPTKLVIMRLTHIHYRKFWCDGAVCAGIFTKQRMPSLPSGMV